MESWHGSDTYYYVYLFISTEDAGIPYLEEEKHKNYQLQS